VRESCTAKEVVAEPVTDVPGVEISDPALGLSLADQRRIIHHGCQNASLVDAGVPEAECELVVAPRLAS
jgi:hypothetical protein